MSRPGRVSIAGLVPSDEDASKLQESRTVKRRNVQNQDTSGRLPHTSVYMQPSVLKSLKEIAVQRDCKVHDLMIQGVRHILELNGKDYDKLTKR